MGFIIYRKTDMKQRSINLQSSVVVTCLVCFFLGFFADPCLTVVPPCMNEADRFSLEALRHIHKQLDDDNDGGIEVNESVEVRQPRYVCRVKSHEFSFVTHLTFWPGFYMTLDYTYVWTWQHCSYSPKFITYITRITKFSVTPPESGFVST